jgi:hypothetical protein
MEKVFTLPFKYHSVEYYLLVQIKKVSGNNQYHAVTITENLSSKLYGSFIFEQIDGHLSIKGAPDDAKKSLVETIASTIEQYLVPDVSSN